MKILEKKCPNCGASIDFNIGDRKVKCEYCKKSYVVEEDKEEKEVINLVEDKAAKVVFTIIFLTAFLMIALIGFMTFSHMGNSGININNGKTEEKEIKSFKDISDEDITKIHNKSAEVLSIRTSDLYKQTKPYKNIGMYLVLYNKAILYDVYESEYEIKGEPKTIYTAVAYNNPNNSNMYGSIVENSNIHSKTFMVGFETIEDLYEIIAGKVENINVIATEGLYTKNN